jgi:hypothetical protein
VSGFSRTNTDHIIAACSPREPGSVPTKSSAGSAAAEWARCTYRATDTHLGRDVALKVLPDAFAQDTERRQAGPDPPYDNVEAASGFSHFSP